MENNQKAGQQKIKLTEQLYIHLQDDQKKNIIIPQALSSIVHR